MISIDEFAPLTRTDDPGKITAEYKGHNYIQCHMSKETRRPKPKKKKTIQLNFTCLDPSKEQIFAGNHPKILSFLL